ncbi:hypothetical protein [Phycicoccus sp. DTK01]|uniref:hypothetical protein n=1 Tax=Phycicoccus sp. DTK01 TaxID=2785745 RepID=UPI001AAB8E61|nr:hypothetical protein [Phycicoccus sp. DTK01]GIL34929.1 hypothetical protein PDTK01_10050 [Phycicoccus sp. DTK01]
MSTTSSPALSTAPAPARVSGSTRLVGGAAVAVAVGIVVENAVLAAAGAPGYDAPIGEVVAYYAAQRGPVAVGTGVVALYLPLLLLLVTGLRDLVERRGGAGALWSRLAVAAGASAVAVLVLVNVLQVGLALSADAALGPSPAAELVWRAHAAAFALALPMLGVTSVATALAAHASGLTGSWQRGLGLAGGVLMLPAGLATVAVADGSPLLFVGLLGLVLWLVWLVVTGVRLLRWGGRSR